MRYRVLGPLEVVADGGRVPLAAQKERLLLAVLVVRANEAVSAAQLIADLWADNPPRTAAKTLQAYMSRLRRALRDASIVTVGAGYRLEADPDDIDAVRFARLAADGRTSLDAGDAAAAARVLDEALALWRGEPLAEFEDSPFAMAEASRLNELRLTIVEDRVAAGLALNQGARMAAELQRLVRAHPLRERLWGQLMMALYQAGRQADALATFQTARRYLIEEAGVEPSEELRQVERAILTQDPSIVASASAARPASTVTVTLLLTDIEGSTRAWEAEPGAMGAAVALHERIVSDVVARHGGTLVKTRGEGDATFSVFERASDAAAAAIALQRAVGEQTWPTAAPLRLRVALHTGEVEGRDGDYYGQAVNRAARLRGLASGGQILLSAATTALIADRLEGGTELVDLGSYQLRDLVRPEHVHALWDRAAGPQPRVTSPTAPALPHPLAALTATPLVGRTDEQARLGAALAATGPGRAQLVLVAGEPGIGKTRLVAEAAARAQAAGALVLYGRCDEEPLSSYQPFVEILSSAADVVSPATVRDAVLYCPELRRLVPEFDRVAGHASDAALPSDRLRMFNAVTSVVRGAARPVVLVVDDLHWADEPTLLLLRHLCRSAAGSPLAIVGTFRPTELGRSQPLTTALADLAREASVDRIDLGGLTVGDVHVLVPPGSAEPDDVWRTTGGNAFFVVEVVRHLSEGADGAVPVSVKHVVGQRVARLGDGVRRLLDAAAVMGAEPDLGLVAEVAGLDDDAAVDAAERAVQAGVLRAVDADRLAFAHALVRDVLLDEMTPPRRIRAHRRAAETIEAARSDENHALAATLAHHWAAAGDHAPGGPAFRYAMLAGDRAASLLAWEECVAHYQRALEQAEATGDDCGQVAALTELGESLMIAGELEEADRTLWRAIELARAGGDPLAFGRAVLSYGVVARSINGTEPIMELLEEALAQVGDEDSPLRAQLLGRLAFSRLFIGTGGPALAEESLATAQRVGDPLALVMAANAMRFVDPDRLDMDAVRAASRELLGTKWALWTVFVESWEACFAFDRGDVEDALGRWDEVVERTAGLVPMAVGQRTIVHVLVAALGGEFADAEERLRRARAELRFGADNTELLAGAAAEAIARLRGRHEGTIPALELLRSFRPDLAGPRLALAYAATGRRDDAQAAVDGMAANDFVALREEWAGVYGQGLLARAVALLGDAEAAARLYDLLAPRAGRLLTLHGFMDCLGAVDYHLGLLAATVGRFGDAVRHLEAAVEVHERLGFPTLVAEARAALARALAASDRDRARRLADSALADAERMGMSGVAEEASAVLRRLLRPPLPAALATARPLVGRTAEVEQLQRWLDDPVSPFALVTGEPGIGKTRLVAEVATSAYADGVTVLYGTCDEHLAVPFQPWIAATRALAAVPEPAARTADPELERFRWFDVVERGLAAQAPCLVVLDDLHWSDAGTLALLRHVLQSGALSGVRVLGAYRDTDLERSRPLAGFVADLWRGAPPLRIDLHGLGEDDVATLLADPGRAAQVHAETEGNPLFVTLIAAQGTDDTRGLPQGIREVLGRRLDRLSPDAVALLRVAALVGREFPLGVIALGAQVTEDAALAAVEEAMAAGLVTEVGSAIDRFAFGHALIARTLADELSTSRRLRLHRRIGELLAGAPDARSAEVAHHLCEAAVAGVAGEAVHWARRAADDALAIGAWEEAARWLAAGLDVLEASSDDDAMRGLLEVQLAEAYALCGDAAEVRVHAERAMAVARKTGDADLLARAALVFVGDSIRTSDAETLEETVLGEALQAIGPEPSGLRCKLLARWAYWDSYIGDRAVNVRRTEEAIAGARQIGDDEALLLAASVSTMSVLNDSGRLEDTAQEIVTLATRLGNDLVAANAQGMLTAAALLRGDVPLARRRAVAAAAAMRESKVPRARWSSELFANAMLAVLDGDWERAERAADDALRASQGTSVNPFLPLGVYLSQLVPIRWMQGRLEELADTLAWAAATSSGPLLWHSAAAMGLAAAGRDDEAREILAPIRALAPEAFLESLDSGPMVYHLAAVCGRLGERDLAAATYEAIRSRRDPVCMFMVYLFLGLYEHHRGNLAAAAGWPEVAEQHLRTAVAEYEHMGLPVWAARAQEDLSALQRER